MGCQCSKLVRWRWRWPWLQGASGPVNRAQGWGYARPCIWTRAPARAMVAGVKVIPSCSCHRRHPAQIPTRWSGEGSGPGSVDDPMAQESHSLLQFKESWTDTLNRAKSRAVFCLGRQQGFIDTSGCFPNKMGSSEHPRFVILDGFKGMRTQNCRKVCASMLFYASLNLRGMCICIWKSQNLCSKRETTFFFPQTGHGNHRLKLTQVQPTMCLSHV